ncbi:MAG TPA: DUF4032 domain-containing protein [Acidimicrobiia bacterium]|nr:DUF4032 domain-containing protein [Acidimicrobiia bacterium]
MGTPRLQIRPSNPDFLDLPWDSRLDDWPTDRLVEMPSGVHRHPVKFVAYDEGVYAIKELPVRIAHQEYRVLRVMNGKSHRVAEAVGLVERDWLDHTDEGSGAVITRYVEHSFPYRRLVSGSGFGARRHQMMNALAGLLVELHMAGCFWGDCSLSNVLYRFDAGEIEAIMIDAETSRIYSELSDGQRGEDLEIMMENIAGEMGDIAAETGGDVEAADLTLGADIASRYHALWSELTEELILTRDDAYRIRQRIARINDLGFSVDDIEITPADGVSHVRMSARVGGRTFNSDALRQRTGIEASENQARIILSDLNYYLAKHGDVSATGKSVGTFKWITGQWEPLLAKITEVWPGSDPVQGYCDLLNHRARLAAARGSDVDTFEAFDSWVAEGFPGFDPEEV